MDALETLWDRLLSRQPDEIWAAFERLPVSEQAAVLAHLWRMAEENGWQPGQRTSAKAALETLAGR
jgi:hypothetical protein